MVAFTYDNRNRVKTSTDVFGHVVEYSYDANANRTQFKLDGNVHTGYSYDNANRLTTLTDDASQNFGSGYDAGDSLTSKTRPNGTTSTMDYDGMSRLKRLLHETSSVAIIDNNFTYNIASQISQITELGQTRNFTYDNVNRLTAMTNGIANESYAFDGVGNRTASHLSATYSYQPYNRMTSTATATMTYNANGNLTQKTVGSTTWTYNWDYENRMTSAANGTATAQYTYDALGRRIRRVITATGEDTKFIYDGLDVVMDDDLISGITKYQNGLGIDDKLSLKNGGVTKYFLADHLGSTVAVADSSGAITEQASYDSFGNQTTNLSTRYQYTGREYDPLSGFYYYRARWYDAALGRFISEDPVGFYGGDINLYGYVRNQPQWYRDPLGLQPGADVLSNPSVLGGLGAAGAAAGTAGAVVVVGGAAIYGASHVGTYTAAHPWNPVVNGPWPVNPFKPPFGYPVPVYPPTTATPRPYCQPGPGAGPFPWSIPFSRVRPIPMPTPDRDGCAEEISHCVQLCSEAEGDPDARHIWGGSQTRCLQGCISERCKRGMRF
jgi:RHS repeat-associated protein